MKERLQSIKQEAITEIEAADTQKSLQDVRVQFLGKKGKSRKFLKGWGNYRKKNVLSLVSSPMKCVMRLLHPSKKKRIYWKNKRLKNN